MSNDEQQEQLPAIIEEDAKDQRIIPFLGDELAAALTATGGIYIAINGLCSALGLNARGQVQRIQRTEELAQGLRRISIETKGGLQPTNCLRLDKIGLWLAGIETARIKGQYREKVLAYHRDLAPIAMRVFMHTMGVEPTPAITDPRLAALAEQYDTLITTALFIQEHMQDLITVPDQLNTIGIHLDQALILLESLAGKQNETEQTVQKIDERTKGLSQSHRRDIQEMVSHISETTKQLPTPLHYGTIYGRIKRRFRVASYNALPDEQFETIMQFLRDMLTNATGIDEPAQGNLF